METAQNPFNDFVFLHATPSDRGSFSLATEKALAKLEKFQLPDPNYFVLQWVQALIASGAENINISYEQSTIQNRFELTITFDGPGYTRTEVDTLYDHVFRSGRDRSVDRLRELALGWLSACSLPISVMCLDSNGRRRLRKSKGEETCEASPTNDHPDGESTPHFLRIEGKGQPELDKILKARCKEVNCRMHVNGDSVGMSQAGVPWPNKPFENGPTNGVMGATYGASATSHLAFLRYGVEFVSRPEPSLQPPVIARISDDSLSKNVSQTDVVKDDAYEDFLTRLRSAMKEMGLELTRKRIPSYQRDALNKFVQSYLVSYIDVRVFDDEERLQFMGEEFANLITFPMFRAAGKSYLSLTDLKAEYQKKGYLLYSLDQRAQLARWDSLLLVLDVEEVGVLRKYFANLTAVSWDEVRALSKGGLQQKLAGARRLIPIVSTKFDIGQVTLKVLLPDTYPSGQALVVEKGKRYGTTLPGVRTTVLIESPKSLSQNEMARVQQSLSVPLRNLLLQLCDKLRDPQISRNQSRMRYAELACELIVHLWRGTNQPPEVRKTPIIGLEDGSLVSQDDLTTYLLHCGEVYLGGAFLEGLESGALDPMPCAEKLLSKLLTSQHVVKTHSVRDRLDKDPEIKFKLRRQTLMRGLANNPMPEQALKNFANESAAEAELVAQLEREYKEALKGPKLFVKPNEERLKQLAMETEEDDFVPFELAGVGVDVPEGASTLEAPSQVGHGDTSPKLPSLEEDLDMLRATLGDFCSTPQSVRIERREDQFALHLSTVWGTSGNDTVRVLRGSQQTTLTHQIPLEGFLRLSLDFEGDTVELLKEGVEQLVIKALHSYKSEPMQTRQRKRLREWLLCCCQMIEHWSVENRAITNDLLDLPLIGCLGDRVLSLTQLRIQSKRLGRTLILAPESREANPDPIHDVIVWQSEWRDELLETLKFSPLEFWRPDLAKPDFDTLLRSALKELTTVVSGKHDDLISPEVIGKLSSDTSFWSRWRAGFLSWDSDYEKALVNPNHKIGKKLMARYQNEPIWSAMLACALFSTINRGLEEVEDRHEKIFLEALLDTLT